MRGLFVSADADVGMGERDFCLGGQRALVCERAAAVAEVFEAEVKGDMGGEDDGEGVEEDAIKRDEACW